MTVTTIDRQVDKAMDTLPQRLHRQVLQLERMLEDLKWQNYHLKCRVDELERRRTTP